MKIIFFPHTVGGGGMKKIHPWVKIKGWLALAQAPKKGEGIWLRNLQLKILHTLLQNGAENAQKYIKSVSYVMCKTIYDPLQVVLWDF